MPFSTDYGYNSEPIPMSTKSYHALAQFFLLSFSVEKCSNYIVTDIFLDIRHIYNV